MFEFLGARSAKLNSNIMLDGAKNDWSYCQKYFGEMVVISEAKGTPQYCEKEMS